MTNPSQNPNRIPLLSLVLMAVLLVVTGLYTYRIGVDSGWWGPEQPAPCWNVNIVRPTP